MTDLADVFLLSPFYYYWKELPIMGVGQRRREKRKFYNDQQDLLIILILAISEYWVNFYKYF